MSIENEEYRELSGWDGGYHPERYSYLEREINGFKLRIEQRDDKYIRGDINAKGCCERIERRPDGRWTRHYDYSDIVKRQGYTSQDENIDKDIKTIEDLSAYLVEYVNTLTVDDWVEKYKKADPHLL